MKKLIVVLLLLAVAGAAIADGLTLEDINGFHWYRWTMHERIAYLVGYWTALEAAERALVLQLDEESPYFLQDMDEIQAFFSFPGSVGDLYQEIERYYESFTRRDTELLFLVAYIIHPEWWEIDD